MRLKTIVAFLAISLFTFSGYSQQKVAKLVQFNNYTSNFEVPSGKTWVIHQIFSNYIADAGTDNEGNPTGKPVRIYIKTLNGDIKTDWQGNRFGPQVFQSNNTGATISFPLVFPEGTKFSLVIIKGNPGDCKAFEGSGYISFFEVTNNP